jgi:hypothetical protein
MSFIVYMHINKLNDKKYVGITCQKPNARWHNGRGYLEQTKAGSYKQDAFAKAILKYGWDNFEHKILFEHLTADEAKAKEIELIAQYHTWLQDPACHGYNMTPGGDGTLKYLDREEAHQVKLACKRKSYEKRKLDPEKYARDLESCRLANERRRKDPEKHEKRLVSLRASLAKRALEKVFENLKQLGYKIVYAGIREDNVASINLHYSLSFEYVQDFLSSKGNKLKLFIKVL